MNRIEKTLAQCAKANKKVLSPYITAGDPSPDKTVTIMHALVDAGADIIELGIPFSDPMAEGPMIQAAMERALAHGVTLHDVLEMVRVFREEDDATPIVLMGYLNPIEQYGYEQFAAMAKKIGVDGTIIVDLPPEESEELAPIWLSAGISPIYLCSPTTSATRMALIKEYAQGYLYYVSLKGVTGAASIDVDTVKSKYEACKAFVSLPVLVGFGIKTAEMAASVAEFADGVVVGAALIEKIESESINSGVQLIASMRGAMDKRVNK